MDEPTPEEIRDPKPWQPFSPEWKKSRLDLVGQRLRFVVGGEHRYIAPFLTSPDPLQRPPRRIGNVNA